VQITRRHHPLEGFELDVVRGGESHLVVRHPDSLTLRIPRAWTDADGESLAPGTAPDTQLTVDALGELVDALRDRV